MKATTLARWERKIRPFVTHFFPLKYVVRKYSEGRLTFLERLEKEAPEIEPVDVPAGLERVLWGVTFRSPIMNAAGIDKNGALYDMFARQGAGGYIAGTTTARVREGNTKEGIRLPFVPLPRSHMAINWLGLPNESHYRVAGRLQDIVRVKGCPIGVSLMESPDDHSEEKFSGLIQGMKLYERSGVDFLEVNVSCPNTSEGPTAEGALYKTLRYIKEHFLDSRSLDERSRPIPVVVKFSNDTLFFEVKVLLDQLFECGFDGVNFGNTSKRYDNIQKTVDLREKKLFDYFTKTFGGGVSGESLRGQSIGLCNEAVRYVRAGPPLQEFHIIRTGGIKSVHDILESDSVGVSMNQWFTGYFEQFAHQGHSVYERMYAEYSKFKK